ncbi:hypothetical protein [Holospora undulata]|nr:hypothetical protein [Holospora undulata]
MQSEGSVSKRNISQTAELIAHLESHHVYESSDTCAYVLEARQDVVAVRP